jgi:hypothetical protein
MGKAFDDADFNLGSDEVTYRIPVAAVGDLNVSVSLNYQAIAHGFLQDLYAADHLEQVQSFKTMYDAQSLKHEQVASAQTTVASGGTPPPAVPVVTLSASLSPIDQGQSTTLSWTSSDATSCTASGAWSGSVVTNGSATVAPTVTSTYTMTCSGAGGTGSASTTVTVNEPPAVLQPTVNLTASPSSVARGGSITLSWSSTDTTSCAASGDWSGAKPAAGTESITINSSVTFTLTCSGDGGSVSDSVSYRARGRRWLDLM